VKKSAGPCPASLISRRSADPRINLKSNELIHPAADEVLRMVTRGAVPTDFRRYPATAEVAAALAEYFGRDSSECVITPGSDIAIHLICDAYARSGGGSRMLLLQSPNYDAWEIAACANGLRIRAFSAPDGDTALQGHQLLIAAEQERGALIALSSPNGPVGGRTPDHLLDELARVASLRDHLFVIDSCYQAFDGALNHHVRQIDGALWLCRRFPNRMGWPARGCRCCSATRNDWDLYAPHGSSTRSPGLPCWLRAV
jgi:histidinol-phosphate/aromatic aminotransferase/cobyric acid decarboxylase-like protein